jgi:hypothetical protein
MDLLLQAAAVGGRRADGAPRSGPAADAVPPLAGGYSAAAFFRSVE